MDNQIHDIWLALQTLPMHKINESQVLVQAENIVREASEELSVETRIERLIEVADGVNFEQELVKLIDRIRNTETEITVAVNCPNFPVVTGSVLFTSEQFIVLKHLKTSYLVNLLQTNYFVGVDQKAVFRTINESIDTTTMWLKNLITKQKQVTIYLTNASYLQGQLIRFSQDHLDLLIQGQIYVIPINCLVLLRSGDET